MSNSIEYILYNRTEITNGVESYTEKLITTTSADALLEVWGERIWHRSKFHTAQDEDDNDIYVKIRDIFTGETIYETDNIGDFKEWHNSLYSVDHVNPKHYKNFFQDFQWLEVQQHISKDIEAVCEGMQRKYVDRRGQKDDEIQELKKSLWYLGFWIAYKANGNKPILIKDIPRLIDVENMWK